MAIMTPHQHHHHNHHGQKVIFMMATGLLGFFLGAQYSAIAHCHTDSSQIPRKQDFIADSVIEFRKPADTANIHHSSPMSLNGNNNSNERMKPQAALDYKGTRLHVVFSTSCTEQMHWESFVFFYHAWKVGQPGRVTRIASGCSEQEAQEADQFHRQSIQTMSSNFHLHLTPDFSKQRIGDDKSSYKYMNKPFGLKSWLENVLQMNATERPTGVEDGVIILMDPDMVLLRPITHDFSNQDVIWVEENPATTMVKHGYPMAQQDGYLDNRWMHIDGAFVTGDPAIAKPKGKDGPIHWNTGPPYLATVKDMYDISTLWTQFAPRVDHINPGLFAEMQGFIWATYKLNLPHTLIKSIVVSETHSQIREGWAYIDNLPDNEVCLPSEAITALPIALHYCGRYGLGPDFFISKYRIKKNFLTCDQNLLMPPPRDIHTKYDYFIKPPPAKGAPPEKPEKTEFRNPNQAKREAFMVCELIDAFNEAAGYFKTNNCRPDANFNKVYTIHKDPKNH
jgi:peptidyl serine alpha-galactosyltransferase